VQFRHFRHFFKYHAFSKKYLAIKCKEFTTKTLINVAQNINLESIQYAIGSDTASDLVGQPSHPSYNIGINGDKLKQKTKKLNVLTGNLSRRITGRLKRQAVESQFLAKNQKAKPYNHSRKDGARQQQPRRKLHT
jgi:hypothetical protein